MNLQDGNTYLRLVILLIVVQYNVYIGVYHVIIILYAGQTGRCYQMNERKFYEL